MTGDVIELKPLIIDCLDDNPSGRPTAEHIVKTISEFLNYHNSISTGNQQQYFSHSQNSDISNGPYQSMPSTGFGSIRITCRASGCMFDVSQESEGYCSACYRVVKINSIQLTSTSVSLCYAPITNSIGIILIIKPGACPQL